MPFFQRAHGFLDEKLKSPSGEKKFFRTNEQCTRHTAGGKYKAASYPVVEDSAAGCCCCVFVCVLV